MDKAPDAFRTISEVAEWLETPAHVLRFWESRFTQIKPVKRAGGRRYYRPDDMALLGGIKHLLHDQGMTIRGVQKILSDQGVRHVAGLSGATPGVIADSAIDHVASGKAHTKAVQLRDAAGSTPPDTQDIPTAQAPEPATSSAARDVSPASKGGMEATSPVKPDPARAAQPEFSFAPPPHETDARDAATGSAQNPPDIAGPDTDAQDAAAASSTLASEIAAPEPAPQSAADAAGNTATEGRSDAPASTPDTPEPMDAARSATAMADAVPPPREAVRTPPDATPGDHAPESPVDALPARALIASRLRAGSRIAPGDLAQARALASRLAALHARMTGQRPGGSPRP